MGKVLSKKIGTAFDSFKFSRADNFSGKEFRNIFPAGSSVTINRISVKFNDSSLTGVLVRAVVFDKDDESNSRIIFEDYGAGFYSWIDKPIKLGADEFLGIQTTKLDTGTPPGGEVGLIAKIDIEMGS